MKSNEKIDKKKVTKNAIIGAATAPMMSTGITAAFDKMDGNSIRKSIKDTAKELKNNKVARYSMLGGSLASAAALGTHSALSQRKKQKEKTASDIVNDNFEKMAGIWFKSKPREFSQEEKNKMIQRIKTDKEFRDYVTWDYGVNFSACTPQDWDDVAHTLLNDNHAVHKTAFDIVDDNFEKMAANKYTKYLESSDNEFERRRREKKLGIKPGTSKEQIRKKVFNKDLGEPKLQNRLNKYKFGPGAESRRRAKINDKIKSLEGKNDGLLSEINVLKDKKSQLHANVNKINEMVDKNKNLGKNIGDMKNDLVNSYKKTRNATIKKKLPLVVGATALAAAGTGYGVYKGIKAKGNKANNNKTAFDIVNNSFEKIASDISPKDILRRDKRKNEAPKTKLFARNTPENFAKGWNVRTKFRPTMHSENELGYNVSSSGFGRRNQRLVAETNLKDLVEMSKNTDDSKKEYLDRVEPHKKNLYKAESSLPKKMLAGTALGALGGGIAGAIKAGPSGAVTMGAIGALPGLISGAGVAELGERGARKKLLNSLNPEERELLGKKKEYWANRQSQQAMSAQKITGHNTYIY